MEVKIKLKVKNVEIELTRDEATELREILEGLTEPKEVIRERVIYRDRPYWPWYKPYYEWYCDNTIKTTLDRPKDTWYYVSDNVSLSYTGGTE